MSILIILLGYIAMIFATPFTLVYLHAKWNPDYNLTNMGDLVGFCMMGLVWPVTFPIFFVWLGVKKFAYRMEYKKREFEQLAQEFNDDAKAKARR